MIKYLKRFQSVHSLFIIILVVFGIFALTYSFTLPLSEAGDEVDHFSFIRFIADQHRFPLTQTEIISIGAKGDAAPLYHTLIALLTRPANVSDWPELLSPRRLVIRAIPDDKLSTMGSYHTEDEYFPFREKILTWHLVRLPSIPLGMLTLTGIYLTMLAVLPKRPYLALAAVGFVAFTPRFLINSSVVNDDNLVVPLITLAIYYLVRIIQGDIRQRAFIILGLLMGAAAITKYHSILLIPEMTLALFILAWRNNWGWMRGLRYWGVTTLTFLAASGWWFAHLFIRFNRIAELGWLRGILTALGDPVISQSAERVLKQQAATNIGYEEKLSWLDWLWLMFRSFWFRYGRDHISNSVIVNTILVIIALLTILGLVYLTAKNIKHLLNSRRNRVIWRLDVMLLAFHFLLYFGLVSIRFFMRPTRETAQGRHLYPAMVSIAFFVILGLAQLPQLISAVKAKKRRYPVWNGDAAYTNKAIALTVNSLSMVFSAIVLLVFIIPSYYPYLPLTTAPIATVSIQRRQAVNIAKGITLEGYSLDRSKVRIGEALPITLFWSSKGEHTRDYLEKICLLDNQNKPAACWQGHPVDGRYPVRAWEDRFLVRDQVYVPLPRCLQPGAYRLALSLRPLRSDTASTKFANLLDIVEPTILGTIVLKSGNYGAAKKIETWVKDRRVEGGTVNIKQIRQGITVINYSTAAGATLSFTPINSVSDTHWKPIGNTTHRCADGSIASISHFIVDPGIQPGVYRLLGGAQGETVPRIIVQTRSRNFTLPDNIKTVMNASFGGEVELLNYNFEPFLYLPGDTVDIKVYWRAQKNMQHRYIGSIHLLDKSMTMYGQVDHILGDDFEYPNVLWAPGEIVEQTFKLPLGKQIPPGLYTLEFGVYHLSSGNFEFLPINLTTKSEMQKHLHLGTIRLADPARAQPPPYELQVNLGKQIQLSGFDLSTKQLISDQPLELALYWQAISQIEQDYTVFTQLIGPDGQVWAQQDNQPQSGRYSTAAWTLQDRVVDRYKLSLKEGAPPGVYRLLAGMYDLTTGQRLTAIDQNGSRLPDDAILLTTLIAE